MAMNVDLAVLQAKNHPNTFEAGYGSMTGMLCELQC